MNLRRDVAEILRKKWQSPQRLAQLLKQVVPRTIHPLAVHRGWIGRRNLPELVEPAEVVEPDVIAVSRRPAQSLHPPLITLRLHHIPAVKRIPPALSGLAEEIRRHARNHLGIKILFQPEQFAVHPDVGAVVINKDGEIAHDADRALRTIAPQRLPLLVEGKLQGAANLQFDGQLLARLLYCVRFAMRQSRRPFIPARQFLLGTQRVEQDEIVEPPRVPGTEMFKAL